MDNAKKARVSARAVGRHLIIFSFTFFIFLAAAAHAQAASLYFVPNAGNLTVGQVFTVTVAVSSPDQPMNAVSGDIAYPTDKIHVVSIAKTNSIIDQWVKDPSFSNGAGAGSGNIHFEGIVLNPGYTGSGGNLIKVSFQATAPGDVSLAFSSGTVLANDGNATEILNDMEPAAFTIAPAGSAPPPSLGGNLPAKPIINSTTHPDETSWYNAKTLQLAWNLPDDIAGVNYALYSSANFDLPQQSKGVLSSVSYDLTKYAEGKWYFFARFENASGWGPVAMRRVNIDFTPPEPFVASEVNNGDLTDPQPLFTWNTTDALSGVAKYMVKIGDGNWIDAKTIQVTGTGSGAGSEYRLPLEAPADNIPLIVDAYDQAGNMTSAATFFSVAPLPMPHIDHYTQQITSQEQLFTADGTAATGTAAGSSALTVTVTLKKGSEVLAFTSLIDQNGHWAVSSTPRVAIGSGLWHLTAQLSDARGALSMSTPPVPVTVGGWFANLLAFFLEWGILIAFVLLLLGGIIALIYFIRYRLRYMHVSMDRTLMRMKEELRGDLKRLERDIEDDKSGRKWVRKEIEHLEDDIKKDIKTLDR